MPDTTVLTVIQQARAEALAVARRMLTSTNQLGLPCSKPSGGELAYLAEWVLYGDQDDQDQPDKVDPENDAPEERALTLSPGATWLNSSARRAIELAIAEASEDERRVTPEHLLRGVQRMRHQKAKQAWALAHPEDVRDG